MSEEVEAVKGLKGTTGQKKEIQGMINKLQGCEVCSIFLNHK